MFPLKTGIGSIGSVEIYFSFSELMNINLLRSINSPRNEQIFNLCSDEVTMLILSGTEIKPSTTFCLFGSSEFNGDRFMFLVFTIKLVAVRN